MSPRPRLDCVLLITVIAKGAARKVVRASREAGAEGGTTIIGKGTAPQGMRHFLGLPLEPEKEVVLTLINAEKLDGVLEAVVAAGGLDRPGNGIAFVLDVKQVAGICHMCVLSEAIDKSRGGEEVESGILYDLIVTIVNRDDSDLVVEASRKAGAEGGTILFGRGTGIHEQAKLFGITIEPEKEIVLTLIDREKTPAVLNSIIEEARLDQPGRGISFVLEVRQVAGINHALNRLVNEKYQEQAGRA